MKTLIEPADMTDGSTVWNVSFKTDSGDTIVLFCTDLEHAKKVDKLIGKCTGSDR
jgi:hypothetical protein